MSDTSFLDEFKSEADWAAEHNITQRTSARYRQQVDGLPHLEFGGRIYIPKRDGEEWIKGRIRRPNPSRGRRAAGS